MTPRPYQTLHRYGDEVRVVRWAPSLETEVAVSVRHTVEHGKQCRGGLLDPQDAYKRPLGRQSR